MVPPYNVLITGSTKGIGYALAKEFLKAGDTVVICSRSEERVKSALESLRVESGKQHVWGARCDVRKGDDVKNLVSFAQEQLNYIDIWINNAGSNAYSFKPLMEASDEDLMTIYTCHHVIGSYGYIDITSFDEGCSSAKQDVYAFGVILLSMISKRVYTEEDRLSYAPNVFRWAWGRCFEYDREKDSDSKKHDSDTGDSKKPKFSVVHPSLVAEDPDFDPSDGYKITSLGLDCTGRNLSERPTMKQVFRSLLKVVKNHTDFIGANNDALLLRPYDGAGSDGRPTPRFAAYGATKRSVVHLTKSLQAELKMQDVKNVVVHNLSPGMVTTDLLMSGANTKQAKFFINVLAEPAEVVAEYLVPNIRSIPTNRSGRPTYIRFLTGLKAYSQIFSRLAFGARRNRHVLEE
ncbi:PREDICTED: chlorophyll(ide) b reductase NOL, chloroplastic [Erythranthe guttata]|uniref:chlorophyll(ide) b reductase NOL, chloroplastic n=1 Tax=Erythranthe guttata TaxID=4155 RepID=UPI00064DB7DA|nr:PREDICTED: chlorophyll(ide) b reductase NOL, chloroplastic [Erythranthe guttata]|eukprot:XP_012830609.1 PREDICTED: chlorophyll(ide) b reductase NOL, chloroplastic [Erythranthe guttata]